MVGGGLHNFSVSPSPIRTNWVVELIGTCLGLGLGSLGTRLCDKSSVVSANYLRLEPRLFRQFYNSIIFVDAAIKALNMYIAGGPINKSLG